jgi:hypothetical protein
MKTILSVFLALILAVAIIPTTGLIKAQEDFSAEISLAEDTITRGSEQTITVETSDKAQIFGSITYASNFTRAFIGNTNDDGVFEHKWTIGGNSLPGTFKVNVIAISEDNRATQASATFTVQRAGDETVIIGPTPEPEQPADNGTVSEGNGTIIVPEEPIPINVTEPVANVTEPVPVENQTIPSINETIPVPVPVNTTAGNETIPVPIPVNSTTNQTVPVPELPTNETIPVANETQPAVNETQGEETAPEDIEDEVIVAPTNETVVVTPDNGTDISVPINDTSVVIPTNETVNPEPTTNETEVIIAPQNDTVIVTPDNTTSEIPVEINDTSVAVPGDIVVIAENETAAEPTGNETIPVLNQTEQLPTEIPVNSTQGNETIPIPIPINQTTGNETIPIPPIEVDIPSNTTIPVQNETTTTEPVKNESGNGNGVKDIIASLDERVVTLENKSASQDQVFSAVGGAIEDMGEAISIIPGLTEDEAANIKDAVNNVKEAITEAIS